MANKLLIKNTTPSSRTRQTTAAVYPPSTQGVVPIVQINGKRTHRPRFGIDRFEDITYYPSRRLPR